EALMFVYDGGTIPATTPLHLPTDELSAARWVEPAEIAGLVADRLGRRIRAALEAVGTGTLSEMENGEV
ncbi:NUDIX hydrolase, partial [Georgenia sp. 10Sc9-8]|nr:NUDIX hydrolase [Georgenia halotolerans]